ncbi:MAG: hypothetical protein ACKVWR_20015 [Acidimicrobiales bacterium]
MVLPPGQRRSGEWIDDTLRRRLAERGLSAKAPAAGRFPRQRVELFRGPDAAAAVDRAFYERGWTDGLPIVAPTLARVEALARAAGRALEDDLGELAPFDAVATVEKVAACAAMAGCWPEHFPLVVAAVEAVASPEFNLAGVQTTDENVAPLLLVSGPSAAALGLNSGFGVLGPGWRANAVIGRALRLVLHCVGGGWPAAVSYAGAGQPGRYTLCVAENDAVCAEIGWPTVREELGFGAGDDVLVVQRAETAVNVTGGLDEIASVMSSACSFFAALHHGVSAVMLAPFVARELAAQGRSKADVREELWRRGRLPGELWRGSWIRRRVLGEATERTGGLEDRQVVRRPEDLTLFVAGGDAPIPQHVWFPSWGFPPCRIARPVKAPGGGSGGG